MGGRFLVPLSAENRVAAGVAAGDEVDVDIALDTAPREVIAPVDLVDAFAHDDGARRFSDTLAYTHRKEWVRWIEEAKESRYSQRPRHRGDRGAAGWQADALNPVAFPRSQDRQ